MATDPDAQAQPRRPRLFVPGAAASPTRPKIVLPGQGLIDPDAPAPEEVPVVPEEEIVLAPSAAEEFAFPEEGVDASELPVGEMPESAEAEAEVFFDAAPEDDSPPVEEGGMALPVDAPATEEFLGQVEPASVPRARPPELKAAPANLKSLAPRTLGPPAGWEMPAEPEPEVQEAGESATVPAWQPAMEEPAYEVEPQTDEGVAEQPAWQGEEEQATETWVGETAGENVAVADEPMPVRVTSSVRVPTPLTSPHSTRPLSRAATQRVRTPTGTTTAQHIHAAHATHAGHAPLPGAAVAKVAKPLPPQRLIPGWLLILIGLLIGALAGIFGVAKSPMQAKLGLIPQADANKFALAILKEERLQVQAMLTEYHRASKINLIGEMEEFRAEQGRKAPERMTMAEFVANAKEDAEEEKRIQEEEAKEDAAAAEEEKAEAAKEEPAPN